MVFAVEYRIILVVLLASKFWINVSAYSPDWKSLDSRPLPAWYDNAKFGVFCHWGLYSVPSFYSEWFWEDWKASKYPSIVNFMSRNYRPNFSYQEFAPQFTAEFFNATDFAEIIKQSGAKYFVISSKHHEGFTMFPSIYSWNWNSMDVGPKRDIIGELKSEFDKIKNHIRFGVYYSLYEWFNPLYLADKKSNFSTSNYVENHMTPQLKELITTYQPEILWSDGDWEATAKYWKSTDLLAWLYNDSPVNKSVVTNDRWGVGTAGHHGGYFSYGDRFDPGHLMPHKWEQCFTLDRKSWGYRRTMTSDDVLTLHEIVVKLARTISCGGNALLNIGPTHYGKIVPIFEERLRELGKWLQVNSEGIYGTKPWIYQNDTVNPDVWYTSRVREGADLERQLDANRLYNPQTNARDVVVYAILLKWPHYGTLKLGRPKYTDKLRAQMLGHNHRLSVGKSEGGIKVDLAAIDWHTLPSTTAWLIRLEYLGTDKQTPNV